MLKQLPLLVGAFLLMSSPSALYAATADGLVTQAAEELELTPDEVTDLSICWNPDENLFEFSFVTPTTGSAYDYDTWSRVTGDLKSISKVEVTYQQGWGTEPVEVHTIENPGLGHKIEFKYTGATRGQSYDFRVTVYSGNESSYGNTIYDCFAGTLPEKITDADVVTTNGKMPVTLTFTAPAKMKGQDRALSSLERIRVYSSYYDYNIYEKVVTEIAEVKPAVPGQKYSLEINMPEISDGTVDWIIESYTTDGVSDGADIRFYLGLDTPSKVLNLKATEQADGTVLITWDAPVKGRNNGYIDPADIKYNVSLKKGESSWDSETIATGITDCSFVYTPAFDEPTSISFIVKPTNASGAGDEINSGSIIVGPALTLPFTDGFDKETSYSSESEHLWSTSCTSSESWPVTWRFATYAYVNSNQIKPQSGKGGLAYITFYGSSENAEYYLTSSKIDVEGADYLDFGFSHYQAIADNAELKAGISFDGGEYDYIYIKDFTEGVDSQGWVNVARGIEVPAGAKFANVRITAIKKGTVEWSLIIDDVSLKVGEAPVPVYPASVSDFSATYLKSDKLINLTFVAPTTSHPTLGDVNNQPLASISKINLLRSINYGDYELIHTFENPAPGATLSYNDTDLSQGGMYYYKAIVYVGSYCDYGQFLDEGIQIGQTPADITDLVITSNKGMAPVYLSFTAPTKDNNGEDLEDIKSINVSRYNNDTFVWDELSPLTEVAPGAKLTYTDETAVSGQSYQYRVNVTGSAGSSYGTTGSVYVGIDEPERPENVVAAVGTDGKVTVTWDVPSKGVNNGYIDVDNLTYSVLRGNGYSDYDATLIQSGIKGTSFTDNTVFGEEEAVKYFVKANNNGTVGYGGISNVVLVGAPSSLPFVENFDVPTADGNITAQHSTWQMTSSEPASDWSFAALAYFIMEGQVQPVDGGKGLAYVYYGIASSYERDDYLTSGNIDVAGAEEPKLTFHLYGVPGYDSALDVLVSADGSEFKSLRKFHYNTDFTEAGWQKYVLPLDIPATAKTARIRFHAHKGAYSCSIAIDNILVDDKKTGVENVGTASQATVLAGDGYVTVSGLADGETTAVYTVAGALAATGNGNCTIDLAPGFYIVKAGTAAAVKVTVK